MHLTAPPSPAIDPTGNAGEPGLSTQPLRLSPAPRETGPGKRRSPRWGYWAALAAVLCFGVLVRTVPWRGFQKQGFDEYLYEGYVRVLGQVGLGRYPDIVDAYIEQQSQRVDAVLPPTRFLYIFCACLWKAAFHAGDLGSLHAVSALFQVLALGLAAVAACRLGGPAVGLTTTALVACSPLQIHFAQHALIDGFFAFWATLALWTLWECLQNPHGRLWLTLYPVALAGTVLTKENAFFVGVAILGLLGLNPWTRFGTVTRRTVLVTILGGVAGVLVLTILSGGLRPLLESYVLLVSKAHHLVYARLTGDGPWYRYLVELLAVSPLVFLLAVGALFTARGGDRTLLFLAAYVGLGFAVMCNVKYGMNLRYTTIWDFPLRFLAGWQIVWWGRAAARSRWRGWLAPVLSVLLCCHDLRFYQVMAVDYPLYELAPNELFRSLKIVKSSP